MCVYQSSKKIQNESHNFATTYKIADWRLSGCREKALISLMHQKCWPCVVYVWKRVNNQNYTLLNDYM